MLCIIHLNTTQNSESKNPANAYALSQATIFFIMFFSFKKHLILHLFGKSW